MLKISFMTPNLSFLSPIFGFDSEIKNSNKSWGYGNESSHFSNKITSNFPKGFLMNSILEKTSRFPWDRALCESGVLSVGRTELKTFFIFSVGGQLDLEVTNKSSDFAHCWNKVFDYKTTWSSVHEKFCLNFKACKLDQLSLKWTFHL